jgi:molybdopterin-guanine dinucleotide biosynthesis protein B
VSRLPPIVAFAAPSNTGKTTLIEGVVRVLVARGLRVAVLKSDAHRVVLDTPGKDSWRFGEAGAHAVAIVSSERSALFERLEGDVSLVAAIERFFPDVDLVLAEGFRRSGLPTIRVARAGGPDTAGWDPPRNIVAWATDAPRGQAGATPILPLDDHAAVAAWIVDNFVRAEAPRPLTVVCPAVGAPDEAAAAARRIAYMLGAAAMVVTAAEPVPQDGVTVVRDLRPSLGLLGALFTGLAAANTPDILFVGPRHWSAPEGSFLELLRSAPRADVVHFVVDGHPDPACARYGHRCLSAIQAALLSDERKLTGWWGQVRVASVALEKERDDA